MDIVALKKERTQARQKAARAFSRARIMDPRTIDGMDKRCEWLFYEFRNTQLTSQIKELQK